VINKQNKLS